MSEYLKLRSELATKGTGQMVCYGFSMEPIIHDGAKLTFVKETEYEIGDIVFCLIPFKDEDERVKWMWIDAHLITKKFRNRQQGFTYEISDNHGGINGYTDKIYGRVIKAEYDGLHADKYFD